MTDKPCVPKIRALYNTFSKTEKRIAQYILNNLRDVSHMSIDSLAGEINVGKASILRFCKKIEFTGFQDFKLGLTRDVALMKDAIYTKHKGANSLFNLMSEVTNENIDTLKVSRQKVDENSLKKASKFLLESKDIVIFAKGIAKVMGMAVKYKFMKLGLTCSMPEDYHFQCFSVSNVKPKTVFIVIDLTGSDNDFNKLLSIAKKKRAKVIAISNFEKSSLTELSDIVLLTEATESPLKDGELTAILSQINILDMLYTTLAMRRGEEHLEHIRTIRDLILQQ
ncbi:MAG TPA: MurR/RpiR family transcriptional regulator [Victivallales bacterium]|nr:MurR/RpiR family transcriptional regulator [Victivallales bacterium]